MNWEKFNRQLLFAMPEIGRFGISYHEYLMNSAYLAGLSVTQPGTQPNTIKRLQQRLS